MIANLLDGLPIHWQGVDDTTPEGCSLFVTEFLGIATTYILRDGRIIGRVEGRGQFQVGYAGDQLKGGYHVGTGYFYELAQRIAEEAS